MKGISLSRTQCIIKKMVAYYELGQMFYFSWSSVHWTLHRCIPLGHSWSHCLWSRCSKTSLPHSQEGISHPGLQSSYADAEKQEGSLVNVHSPAGYALIARKWPTAWLDWRVKPCRLLNTTIMKQRPQTAHRQHAHWDLGEMSRSWTRRSWGRMLKSSLPNENEVCLECGTKYNWLKRNVN